ncbi:MAG: hypothetical protein ACD_62C00575G0003 [uncultured bacterium]|nr:MAG: hypothetical protein ACD_62C00575G0003 [uncultured bacterium]
MPNMKKKQCSILLGVLVLCLNCFGGGIQKQGSVLGYHHGVVKTQGGSFRVGELSDAWQEQDTEYRAVLFLNKNDASTITIDSWCQRAAADGSLEGLTQDLLRGLADVQIQQTQMHNTHGRAALLTEAQGDMDGREIFMSTFVFKMNACVFDFVYVTLPGELLYYQDFKNMIDGFAFIKGPKLL